VFRERVHKALASSSRPVLSRANERRLIDRGSAKLGLSKVLARQIVHRVAAELNKRIASQEAIGERPGSEGVPPDHPELPAFLERAAAILAEQRGINARSRFLLAAAARELGLSDAELERGVAALTGASNGADVETVWQQEREQAFRVHLRKTLALLPHKVATVRMEQTWVGEGQRRYALDTPTARKLVRAVAAEQGIRLVTEDQAAGHVETLVEQLLGDSVRLDEATRARVFAEGSQWGLTPMQVDAIIRDRMRTKGRAGISLQSMTGMLIAAFSGCFLALMGLVAWLLISRSEPPDEGRDEIGSSMARGLQAPVAPSIDAPTGEEWWSKDEDLLVAVTQARAVVPDMKDALLGLSTTDSEARARAYRKMVRAAVAYTDQADRRDILQEVIAGCYAADPSDECAMALADELLGLVPATGSDPPDTYQAYRIAFWAVRSAVTALIRPGLPPERRDELVLRLDRAIGATIDPSLAALELQRLCFGAFCRHLYRVVTAAAGNEPLIARQLYEEVTREAVRYLDLRTIELANVEFLAAALPAAGQSWREFASLIQRTVDSADPLVVLRLVDLFERLQDETLRGFVADRLLRRTGIVPQSLTTEEVARKVREALGAEEAPTGAGRREALEQSAALLLAALDDADLSDAQRLQQIADLAHTATMACALAQGEVGEATFDDLQREGAIRLQGWPAPTRNETATPRTSRPDAKYHNANLNRYVDYLLNPRGSPIQRNVFLRSIASFAPVVPDLDPPVAEKLVSYFLRPKPDGEHEAMLEFTAAVGRWKHVRLALADQVLETHLQKERVEEILSRILPAGTPLDEDQNWKQQAHELLLEDVVQEMSRSGPKNSSPDRVFDDLSAAMRESYVTQSRLLGVSPDRYSAAQRPSDLLRLMAEKISEKLAAARVSEEDERHLEALPYQFDAIQYAGSNDLQRTVLLQRLWLRTLAADVSQVGGKQASRAAALVTDLEQADATATDLFGQMRAGERALVEMWLLAAAQR
jgi:hypothetical protein